MFIMVAVLDSFGRSHMDAADGPWFFDSAEAAQPKIDEVCSSWSFRHWEDQRWFSHGEKRAGSLPPDEDGEFDGYTVLVKLIQLNG